MKISVLLTAAALALGGTAMAQQQNESLGKKADRQFDRAENATNRTLNGGPGQPSLGQRADTVFDRMEDGTKRVWNRVTGKSQNPNGNAQSARVESRPDTRTMGAGPASPAAAESSVDDSRRSRMDEAYRNYQSRAQR